MRKYFLSYGLVTGEYYLDYGCFDRNRKNLGRLKNNGKNSLIIKLEESIPIQKKIILYGDMQIEENVKKLLVDRFKNTHIKIQFVKDLASLCKDKPKI